MKTIQTFVDECMKHVRKTLEMGHFHPHLVLIDRNDTPHIALIEASSREAMVACARTAVETTEAEICLVVHEAWLAHEKMGETKPYVRPSQRPDSIDVLIVYGETRAGETAMATVGVKSVRGRPRTYDLPREGGFVDVVSTWNLFSRTAH